MLIACSRINHHEERLFKYQLCCCLCQQHPWAASFSLLFAPKPINGTARLGRSIVASKLVTKLRTVTHLLTVRIPVHRERKEPDIVALSWCSEASNISQKERERERERRIYTSKCVCQLQSSQESNVTPHKCCNCFLQFGQNAVLCQNGWVHWQAAWPAGASAGLEWIHYKKKRETLTGCCSQCLFDLFTDFYLTLPFIW